MFRNSIRQLFQGLYYRIMIPVWRRKFSPHIEQVQIAEREFRFFFSSTQADAWYFPPKKHAIVEYEWVAKNVKLSGERILDIGAHHGHYSMFLAASVPKPASLFAVEPLPSNCSIIEINASLNGYGIEIVEAAVSTTFGTSSFLPRTNGKLLSTAGMQVRTIPLHAIDNSATVVKVDIEGNEFQIFPEALERMKNVHTWIIELHPRYGNVQVLIDGFIRSGYHISILDKENDIVRELDKAEVINLSTSILCRR